MRDPMPLEAVLNVPDAISQVQATAAGIYWLATIAAEDGRVTVRRWASGVVTDLTPDSVVRSRVMEYGGGAYAADGAAVVYCDDRTGLIWFDDGDGRRPLTEPGTAYVYGGLHLSLADGVVVAVREDHSASPEPRTEIVALSLASTNPDGGRVLATGADFYAGPVLRSGLLAWYQWNHPDMSWDTSEVWSAPLAEPGAAAPVAGRAGVSTQHPLWLDDGVLAVSEDTSGFWNWRVVGGPVWRVAHDCDVPTWVLTPPPAAVVADQVVASVVFREGRGELALWDSVTGAVSHPLPGTAAIESVASHDGTLYVVAQWPDRPATLVSIQRDGTSSHVAGAEGPQPAAVSPIAFWADGPAGPVHSWLYLPEAQRAPLIVFTHGGPTSMATCAYDAGIAFWVSRGFAVVDVNYSGSTGFGRVYRDRLRGRWGELDVADAEAVVLALVEAGHVDPDRVAITGGSAGGFTTLKSLVSTDIYAAGISRYGIGYLPTLATDTHKAESRYLDGLVAPWPEGRAVYEDRSPINHLEDLRTPMLILQGSEDKVVPPAQAEQMAEAVRSAGQPVALLVFEGEGHGFRTMSARRRSLEAQVSFLEQVFGMPESPDVPRLEIENLAQ
ncbi:MAG TPA: prolyl oligopeptidase family serine peptidase [Arachnia sp.]|nr:prolyl oligopeptidase family serine peptidase [Arachnia sp.]